MELTPNLQDDPAKAGEVLQETGRTVRLGAPGHTIELKSREAMSALLDRFEHDAAALALDLGVPEADLPRYRAKLVEALDDLLKPTTVLVSGDVIDLSTSSDLAHVIGLDAPSTAYGEGRTLDGRIVPAAGTLSLLGLQLQRSAPPDPLEGVKFISSAKAGPSYPYGRSAPEFETVRALTGIEVPTLLALVDGASSSPEFEYTATEDSSGRTVEARLEAASLAEAKAQLAAQGLTPTRITLRSSKALRRMREPKDATAFAFGNSNYNEVDWSARAHRLRESSPYVSLVVEPGNLVFNDDGWEVSLGTDYNVDLYYRGRAGAGDHVGADDGTKPRDILLDNDLSVRARLRYDDRGHFENSGRPTDGELRRILIQAKLGTTVDAEGTKRAYKIDTRADSFDDHDVADTFANVPSGQDWDGQEAQALRAIHTELTKLGKLPTIGRHKNVLSLEPGAYVVSERSRFHFNEVSSASTLDLYKQGSVWIEEVMSRIERSALPDAEKNEIIELGKALTDPGHQALVARVKSGLADLGVLDVDASTITSLLPSFDRLRISNEDLADQITVVADGIKAMYDEFAAKFDDVRDRIAPEGDRSIRRLRDRFIDYVKQELDPSQARTQTVGPFLTSFEAEMDAHASDFGAAFAHWLEESRGDTTLSDVPTRATTLEALHQSLINEHLDILHRQIEAAGTAAQTAAFTTARSAYVDTSPANWNFLIDTFDVSKFYTPEAWSELSDAQRIGNDVVPADVPYHTMVVNEVQIELTSVDPYVDAIDKTRDDLFAGFFIEYALEHHGAEIDTADPSAFTELLKTFSGDAQEALLVSLNEAAKARKVAITFGSSDIVRILEAQARGESTDLFVPDRRTQDDIRLPKLDRELKKQTEIFKRLQDVQTMIADSRGRRVLDVVEDELPRGARPGWGVSELSKGETALRLLDG